MREDYNLKEPTEMMELQLEKEVISKVKEMSHFKKLSIHEIANTALKRFIITHKDFLPPRED